MLALTEEEALLADQARAFLRQQAPPAALRQLRDRHDGRDDTRAPGRDPALWAGMANLGWAGMLVDESLGGSGFGHAGASLVCAEIGRQLSATPFISTAVMAAVALRGASATQRARWLPRVAGGEAVVALALDEERVHAPERTALAATPSGDGFVLRGSKTFVADGLGADAYIVLARSAGAPGQREGLTLFLVDAARPGIATERLALIDSGNSARVGFDGVSVSRDAIIGQPGDAGPLLEATLDAGRVALAAELAGIASGVFALTLDHLKQRRQFGRAIGSFQALQHRAAQLHCQIELAWSAAWKAARLLDAAEASASDGDAAQARLWASVAKAKASTAARLATEEAVQMHGGTGMTDALDIGLYLKRARVAGALLGDDGFHAGRVATLLGY